MNFLFYQFYNDILSYYLTANLYCALLKQTASAVGITSQLFSSIQATYEIDAVTGVYVTDGGAISTTGRSIINDKLILPEIYWQDDDNILDDVYYAVVYDKTTSKLISKLDFQGEKTSDNGWFRISFGSNGFIKFTI